jgi:hypothetical protein
VSTGDDSGVEVKAGLAGAAGANIKDKSGVKDSVGVVVGIVDCELVILFRLFIISSEIETEEENIFGKGT